MAKATTKNYLMQTTQQNELLEKIFQKIKDQEHALDPPDFADEGVCVETTDTSL